MKNDNELWDRLSDDPFKSTSKGNDFWSLCKASDRKIKKEKQLKRLQLRSLKELKKNVTHFETRYLERVGMKPDFEAIFKKPKNHELQYICSDNGCELYSYAHPRAVNRKYIIVFDPIRNNLVTILNQKKI